MSRAKKHMAEQVVNLLRQNEVAIANGKTTAFACKEAGIVEQENSKLKRLVTKLTLNNLVLRDIALGNF